MNKYYAQIDDTGLCIGKHYMSEITDSHYIEITADDDVMGKKYDKGKWLEVPKEEVPVEPTQLDRIETMVSQNYEQAQQSAVDSYTMELMESGIL